MAAVRNTRGERITIKFSARARKTRSGVIRKRTGNRRLLSGAGGGPDMENGHIRRSVRNGYRLYCTVPGWSRRIIIKPSANTCAVAVARLTHRRVWGYYERANCDACVRRTARRIPRRVLVTTTSAY